MNFRADLQSTVHFSGRKALLVCDGRTQTLTETARKPTRNLIQHFYEGKEYISVQNHTGQVQKPENPPLLWQVNTTCSIMM